MYSVSEDVRSTYSEDGAVLLTLRRGRVLKLNATGALVFRYLEAGVSETQIVAEMCDHFGIVSRAAEEDISAFLNAAEQLGLVYRTLLDTNSQLQERVKRELSDLQSPNRPPCV